MGPTRVALDNFAVWEYSLPLTSQWIIKIDPVNTASATTLLNNIGVGTSYDKSKWALDPGVQQILFNSPVNNETLGTYFARKVEIPGESFQVQDAILGDLYGYMPGTVGGNRTPITSKTFEIGFISTNLDFVDSIIRPWIITAGYKGLLAQAPNNSIKCNISIIKYTKGLAKYTPRPITTMYTFFDCVPTSIQTETLSYTDDDKEVIKMVPWTYINYKTSVFSFDDQPV